jgi:hypothetical protein
MPTCRPALVLAALSLVAASAVTAAASSEEFACRRGDLVRRVEVQFADGPDRLPCEVVYWRDSEAPGQPKQLWSADNQLAFCTAKARELLGRLQSAGWSCDGASMLAEDAAEMGAGGPSEPFLPGPAEAAAPAPRGATGSGKLQPDQAALQAALDRDISRLDELAGSGGFEPGMARLGDLNGDGREDAAVLLIHRREDGATTRHLLAYLFDGGTFRPVARINLDAYYQNFTEVAIREIADGAVELLLHMRQAGDPECCPTGRRFATFALQDGQLVLSDEGDAGA